MQVTDHSIDIPTSIYTVKIIDELKGNLNRNKIDISILGGYDEDGSFHGVSLQNFDNYNDYLPKEDHYYLISFNQDEVKSGIIDIEISEFVQKLPNYDENIPFSHQSNSETKNIIDSHTKYLFYHDDANSNLSEDLEITPMKLPDDGGSGSSGESFDNPITLYEDTPTTVHLSPGEEIYFKFTINSYTNIIFQSLYENDNVDTFGYLYDSSRALIDTNDDSGIGFNFLFEEISTYIGETFFIRVKGYSPSTSGLFSMLAESDENCNCINEINHLLNDFDSVVFGNIKYHYDLSHNDIKPIFENAVDTWNELGLIDISEGTVINKTLIIKSHTGSNSYARFIVGATDIISLNYDTYVNRGADYMESSALHELGHTLGLEHIHYGADTDNISFLPYGELNSNVMSYDAPDDLITLGPCDKYVYFYLWK